MHGTSRNGTERNPNKELACFVVKISNGLLNVMIPLASAGNSKVALSESTSAIA